jgi:hypothetical protein
VTASYPITDQHGIVGGTTHLQRQAILRGRRQEQLAGLSR